MSNPNLPPSPDTTPDKPKLSGHAAAIAAMGAAAFGIERGPNDGPPEKLENVTETTPDIQVGPKS